MTNNLTKLVCTMLVAAGLSACGDSNTAKVDAAAVTSIEQQNREIAARLQKQQAANEAIAATESAVADRERYVSNLREIVSRWNSLFQQLAGRRANEIGDATTQLQAVRNELVSASTSACTEPRRDAMVRSMDAVVSLLEEFKAAKGDAGPDFARRLSEASAGIQDSNGSLSGCL